MKAYEGYSSQRRLSVQYQLNKMIKKGEIPNPKELACEICGQKYGIKEYHCGDYSENYLASLHCLCFRCHRNWHIRELGASNRGYAGAIRYFERIEKGEILPAVYSKFYTKEMEKELWKSKKCQFQPFNGLRLKI